MAISAGSSLASSAERKPAFSYMPIARSLNRRTDSLSAIAPARSAWSLTAATRASATPEPRALGATQRDQLDTPLTIKLRTARLSDALLTNDSHDVEGDSRET